jgi:DNA/RNA-binding domain of Phe-tRNA-synthetase-like protein
MAVFGCNPDYRRVSLRLFLPEDLPADAAREDLRRASAAMRAQGDPAWPGLDGWRSAYRLLGLPDAVPLPQLALLAWARSPDGVPPQGAIRDLVHAFMLEHGVPAAAYDLAGTQGDLWLRPSRGRERFVGIGETAPSVPELMEIILADSDEAVLARFWHGAQSSENAARSGSRQVLVHLDLLPPDAERRAGELADAFLALALARLGAVGEARAIYWERPEIAWPAQGAA